MPFQCKESSPWVFARKHFLLLSCWFFWVLMGVDSCQFILIQNSLSCFGTTLTLGLSMDVLPKPLEARFNVHMHAQQYFLRPMLNVYTCRLPVLKWPSAVSHFYSLYSCWAMSPSCAGISRSPRTCSGLGSVSGCTGADFHTDSFESSSASVLDSTVDVWHVCSSNEWQMCFANTEEISGAVKESLQTALIELVRQGRDVDKAGSQQLYVYVLIPKVMVGSRH